MDSIQRASAYYGKQIVDINSNPEDRTFEEFLQKVTIRDAIVILGMFPEEFKDLTFGDIQEITLDPSKGEALLEGFSSMTEEQEKSLTELLGKYFPDV